MPASGSAEALRAAVDALRRNALEEAETWCQRALADRPDDFATLHVAGVVAFTRGELDAAAQRLSSAEALRPGVPDVLSSLGVVESRRGNVQAALSAFDRALTSEPRHAPSLLGLGAHQQTRGALDAARLAFSEAAHHHPHLPEAWCNLAGVLTLQGQVTEAVDAYRQAIAVRPTFSAGHHGLVFALATLGNPEWWNAAVRHWREACPDDPIARHLAASLSGEKGPGRCPPDFVARYFDAFAASYDVTIARLETRVAATLERLWHAHVGRVGAMLDAGCGTGSTARWVRPFTTQLHGIDASPSMVEHARALDLYDRLDVGDLLAAPSKAQVFDAVVLADVVPYFGALRPLFVAMHAQLKPGGWLLACGETSSDEAVALKPTGRYQHRPKAVTAAAKAAGFEQVVVERGVLRNEGGHPVEGWFVVLRASSQPNRRRKSGAKARRR